MKKNIFYETGCCRNCEYSSWRLNVVDEYEWRCHRFPAWIKIDDVDDHWCGEWKAEVQNELYKL